MPKRKFIEELKETGIVDVIGDAVSIQDTNFKVLYQNKCHRDIVGDQVGEYCYKAYQGKERVCKGCHLVMSFKDGKIHTVERSRNTNEGVKYYENTASLLKDATGKIIAGIEVVRDITERKRIEKRLKEHEEHLMGLVKERTTELNAAVELLREEIADRMEAEVKTYKASQLASLGELAAGVAHEINNPINGIINYAQILNNKNKEGTKEQNISKLIIKEGERIADVVHSLLSFERSSKEEKHSVAVYDILSDTLKLIEPQIRNDGIKSEVNISSDLPKIFAHPQQIKHVFLNIINNARYALNQKFPHMYESKIFNIYGKEVTIDDIPYIQIMFYDNGTGIREEILDKVMNPFLTTSPRNVNAGLGLSISHSIINSHSGKLTVNSKEGEFTTITVGLPVWDK